MMSWLDAQHLRIFLLPEHLNHPNWAEQVLGTVVRPVVLKFIDHINWVWIGRYSEDFSAFSASYQLPERYNLNGQCFLIDFRVSFKEEVAEEAREWTLNLTYATDYYAPKWNPYNVIDDLVDENGNSKNRFIRPDANDEERAERAHLIVSFMDATARLMLHSLVEIDGQWLLEPNDDKGNNPDGSFFQSIHHLFYNCTAVPTPLYVAIPDEQDDSTETQLFVTAPYMAETPVKVPKGQWKPIFLRF